MNKNQNLSADSLRVMARSFSLLDGIFKIVGGSFMSI
jgi:hypothetical protein